MEKAIQRGKWFRIKKDGKWYRCKIESGFDLYPFDEITVEKLYWFTHGFTITHKSPGSMAFFKAGEYWYTVRYTKALFEEAYEIICKNNVKDKLDKFEKKQISHQKEIK